MELLFSNTGNVGAVFHVYDKRNLELIPRRYTVEAGKTLSDVWNGGDYELWVYSSNGFVRTFSGNTQRGMALEVQVCYELAASTLYVKLANRGTATVQAALQANAYRSDGPWTLAVEPGAVAEQHWSIGDSGNWYDFTVAAEGFERRFAGRMENGRHGVSDPAMARHL
ncbi:Non-hemolytic phospholipase C precursor [compost metagenome]